MKNLQTDTWSIMYLPNFPEESLNPLLLTFFSEFKRILRVEIVEAHRKINLQFNSLLNPLSVLIIFIFVASSVS